MAIPGIELHHLRCYLALAEERHFTRAADRLGLSQPTVSRTIRRLEELLGRRLLERTTRRVALTAAGERLYGELRELLPRLEAALLPDPEAPVFRIGFAWGFPATWPQAAIERFEAETGVGARVYRRDAALAGVDSGDVDVAILRGDLAVPGLAAETLLHERRIAAVSVRSPLAARDEVGWRELARVPLVLNEAGGTTGASEWPPGERPEIAVRCGNFDEWLEAVAGNRGVGVVPESIGRQRVHPFVSFVPIPDAPLMPLQIVFPRHNGHPLTRRFLAHARATVRQCEGGGGGEGGVVRMGRKG
ncbi:LysR family transcriptional regulator [Streptomyces sp. BHT-5-2]|uniref:LysR family transcriptional regulator n=1 Tax=Streptomyces sp. BHT-5-2 TaxID=2866715 RepID=UPI0021B11670|nr:LysR family transcriptional regulator [Streptomyces sp. BHT-5-2]